MEKPRKPISGRAKRGYDKLFSAYLYLIHSYDECIINDEGTRGFNFKAQPARDLIHDKMFEILHEAGYC